MADVRFVGVDKVYDDGTHAVRSLDLSVDDGHLLVLVGPSGCGKTTALRMVAGLDSPTSGAIEIGGEAVNDLDPKDRDIAMVFQSYALYPHMSVANNIGFPLRLRRVSRADREAQVRAVARILGLESHLDRKPPQLSGGQRQRVAMGRALVREPSVFLMDEPLSNLDAKLRVQMRAEITSIQHKVGVTGIYVTHDQVEAMTIGDRVAVMRGGLLQQVAEPQVVYDAPANVFVASFVGSPPMNLVESQLVSRDGALAVALGGAEVVLDDAEVDRHPGIDQQVGDQVVVGVRPERLVEVGDAPAERRIAGRVKLHEALGSDSLVHFALADSRPLSSELVELAHDIEDAAENEDLEQDDQAEFVARFDPRSRVREGNQIELAIEPGSLHLFSTTDGSALT